MCEFGCCGEIKDDFVPIDEVVGPLTEFNNKPTLGRVVVLQEPTGAWAISEEAKAKIS